MRELVRTNTKPLILWLGEQVGKEVTSAMAEQAVPGISRALVAAFLRRCALRGRAKLVSTTSDSGKEYRYLIEPKFLSSRVYKRAGGTAKRLPQPKKSPIVVTAGVVAAIGGKQVVLSFKEASALYDALGKALA